MDIIERLRGPESVTLLESEAADEIERLRKALKTFADNVRETNAGIDKNWAETVYPLKAENQRLREALRKYADDEYNGYNANGGHARDAIAEATGGE